MKKMFIVFLCVSSFSGTVGAQIPAAIFFFAALLVAVIEVVKGKGGERI